jgi:hypothetical protein
VATLRQVPDLERMMFSWARASGLAGLLLLAATGRPGLPAGFSVL